MSTKHKVNEDGAAVSVGGGSVPSITDATTNYALQLKKRTKKKMMLKRATPPYNVNGIVGDNT